MSYKNKEDATKWFKEKYSRCKDEMLKTSREWKSKNKEKIKVSRQLYEQTHPWRRFLGHIKKRCEIKTHKNYKYYGEKGIRCLITIPELKELWFRDKAYNLKRPSIDRKESTKNYTFDNCRFVELSVNCNWRNK